LLVLIVQEWSNFWSYKDVVRGDIHGGGS